MNLFDRFKAFFGRISSKAMMLVPTWVRGQPQYSPVSVLSLISDGYKKNEIAYACVREIARTASEAKLKTYQKDRDGETKELSDHPLQQLLDDPNPIMSQYEMHEAILTDMNVAGEAFILKERSGARRVVALWRLRPDRVAPVPGGSGEVVAYKYSAGDTQETYEAADVIHLPFFDPGHDYRGLSPMEIANRVTNIDNELTDFVKKFFDQGAMIPGYIKYLAGALTKAERQRIRKQWAKVYGGSDKWAAPPVFDVDMDFVKTGMSYRDMEFGDLRSTMEIRTCMIFGVPPILLPTKFGLDAATYSNYELAEKSFWTDTLSPLYRRIEDKWQKGLAPEFGAGLVVRFDFSLVKALQEDVNDAWKRAVEAFKASIITRNDARQHIGLPAVAGGDVFLQPIMLIEVGAQPSKALQIIDGEWKRLPPLDELKADRWARAVDMVARAWEGRFKELAKGLFAAERKDVLKILRKAGKTAKQAEPFAEFLARVDDYYKAAGDGWRSEFVPAFAALMEAQGEQLTGMFGISFDIARPEVEEFLNTYTMTFADEVVQNTWTQVRQVIIDGQREGWTVPQMRDAIQGLYGQNFELWRAERIARSETIRSSNAAAQMAYRTAGVEKMQWWDGQAGACIFCEAMHKTTISTRAVFFTHGQDAWVITDEQGKPHTMTFNYGDVGYPPLHPNCRCTVIPIVEV